MTRLRFACILLLPLCAVPAWSDDLTTISGKGNLNGTLEKITDSDIVLKASDKLVPTPLAQVLNVHLRDPRKTPAAEIYIEVHTADDSILRCAKITYGKEQAELKLTTGALVKVPMAALLTVLRDAQDDVIKSQFDKLKKTNKRISRIYTRGAGGLNPIPGEFGAVDVAVQTIKFKPENFAESDFAFDKLQAVQFAAIDVKADAPLCVVIDVDGNRLVASKLSYDAGHAIVTTPYGQKVALENKLIAKLDFNFGRLTYLSDLEAKIPDSVLLGGFSPVRKDANLDGNPIILQDKKYDKGLSMYAGAQVEYALSGKYKKLSALLGVDSRIAEEGQGEVTLKIYCDNELKFSQKVSSAAPAPINLDIQDVFLLRIVVIGSNFTNYSGHATLANAQVSQ